MAIYNNREVSVIGPNSMANSVETIQIQYMDGSNENVPVSKVRFTKDEKNSLLKNHPSKFEDVSVAEDKDLQAVRVGVAPSYDEDTKRIADEQALRDQQNKAAQKQAEDAKTQADKDLDKKVNSPAPKAVK